MGLIVLACNQSQPEKEVHDILAEIHNPAPTSMYFRNIQSLPNEIAFLDTTLRQTDSAMNPARYGWLITHRDLAMELMQSYNELKTQPLHKPVVMHKMENLTIPAPLPNYSQSYQTMAIASQCKRMPCPKDTGVYLINITNITFYTVDTAGSANLVLNDSLIVLNKGMYFPDLRIRKLDLPPILHPGSGDSLRIEIPVAFYDSLGTVKRITMIYGLRL